MPLLLYVSTSYVTFYFDKGNELIMILYMRGAKGGGGGQLPPYDFRVCVFCCCFFFLLVSSAVSHVHDDDTLPHYENFGATFAGAIFFLLQVWRSILRLAQQYRGSLPSLSKLPGAAPEFILNMSYSI